MTPELNWAGQPILDGDSYGGKPQHVSKSWSQKLEKVSAKQHYCVVTESHLAEVFGNGAYSLTRVLRPRSAWNYSPEHTGQAAIAL